MTPHHHKLLRAAMVKLDTDAAGDERDALAIYGSDRTAARLAKALEPPTPSAPVPAPVRAPARRPVTRRDLGVAFDAYSDAMTKILREQRDSITALQQRSSDAERTYAELTAKVQQLEGQLLDAQATLAARAPAEIPDGQGHA